MPNPESPGLSLTAVPRASVETETLAPLPGARDAPRPRQVVARTAAATMAEAEPALPPDPLPEVVTQGQAMPGRLLVEAGMFFRRDLAQTPAGGPAGWPRRPGGALRQWPAAAIPCPHGAVRRSGGGGSGGGRRAGGGAA